MKKAFIPLGISGAFAVFGLVAAVALTGGLGGGGYEPKDLVIEGDGGTDAQATSPASLVEVFSYVEVRTGEYYQSLENGAEPQRVEGKYNSIGVVDYSKGTNSNITYDRTLAVVQNEYGVVYQYDGVEEQSIGKADRNFLFSYSGEGMYMLFNKYDLTLNNPDDPQMKHFAAQAKGCTDNRGNWYFVGFSDAHMQEMSSLPYPTDKKSAAKYYSYQDSYSLAMQYRNQYLSNVDQNCSTLQYLVNYIANNVDSFDFVEGRYSKEFSTGTLYLDFTSPSAPVMSAVLENEREDLTFAHIGNAKVPYAKKSESKGDFYDLFGEALEDFYLDYYTSLGM